MDLSRYLDIFISDSHEHLASAADLVPRLAEPTTTAATVRELFRHAHSIKGMSATMGYRHLTDVAHAAEELLSAFRSHRLRPDGTHVRLLLEAVACMERMVDGLQEGGHPEDELADAITERLRSSAAAHADDGGADPGVGDPGVGDPGVEPVGGLEPTKVDSGAGGWRLDLGLTVDGSLPLQSVSAVLARLGELGTVRHTAASTDYRSIDDRHAKLIVLLESTRERGELEAALSACPQVTSFALSPEPASMPGIATPAQGSGWVRVRARVIDDVIEYTRELLLEQNRLAALAESQIDDTTRSQLHKGRLLLRDLHARVIQLRLVPFETVAYRISRTVRELSAELDKPVRFDITGGEVQLDRVLLEALIDPLTHLIRNALDHGIESPEARKNAGKDPVGSIHVEVTQSGDRTVIVVADDGRGLDGPSLLESAVSRGFVSREQARELGEQDARMLITLPGFSTVDLPSAVSGRGVGMDVVRTQVEAFGGKIALQGEYGCGTSVELSLPSSRAIVNGLLVRCSGELYAVPVDAVECCLRVGPDDLRIEDGVTWVNDGDRRVPASRIDSGCETTGASPPASWALVARGRDGSVALLVDEVLGRRGLVVEPLDSALHASRVFGGAAVLRDGSVALLIDPRALNLE
ncbi:MAG: chemotaxis protein CheA [Acidobacteriota bacterium]|nr:chemotaxis protein CheA [Acidobacteriota bacterium]